ncbi:hypothetical protein CLHUN_14340 [Ruminiclostridium hungatei]|uniref:Uncharacterized protein n=1 Tax=Ruminiclostridium hungatei TaxID=48256 RepID=A0A1V4SLZ3_RUMHU|nr:hypothetical protein [Ruminiclostridium hungatei]OPX44880.1 hypothetical protein CLHUN_14340 [Ruminiclostridium hungatei]
MFIKKLLSAICVISLMVSILLYPSFASSSKEDSDAKWNERRAFLEENIKELGAKGPDAVDAFLKKNGVEKSDKIIADPSRNISPMSAPGSVTLSISAYRDQYSSKYLVTGYWTWNDIGLVDTSAGALDGVALSMCQTNWNPVTGYVFSSNPAQMAIYDNYGTLYDNAGSASVISKSGVAYTFQDKWITGINKFCGYSGSAWFWLDTCPDQLPIYIKMDFIHTWTSAQLNNFGISWPVGSAPTLNMNFSTVPSKFMKADQITLYSWPRL